MSINRGQVKLKVCGMRDAKNISDVAALEPDYMGFIFYPLSKRFAGKLDGELVKSIPSSVIKTGVFVNEGPEEIKRKAEQYELQAIQLHGNETAEVCKAIRDSGIEVIKAFGIDEAFDFETVKEYEEVVDHFLFDTKTSAYGGSGKSFNWQLLERNISAKTYFLSGGIDMESIIPAALFGDSRLYALDLNSKFEAEPGLKDVDKLNTFFLNIRKHSAHADKEDL